MEVKLTRVTEDPVMAIEEAASKCYDSTPNKNGKIMEACYDSGHESVLEHVNFTFEISGVSRTLLAQLTRHRIASFSVRSQRYCKEDGFQYVTPKSLESNLAAKIKYMQGMDYINNLYISLVDEYGVPPEDARYMLPNACCTELVMTINLRSLINLMRVRLCTRAQWEIRELAMRMKIEIVMKYPQLTYMLTPKCEANSPYNFCTESKSCGRHPRLSEVHRANIL